MPERNGRRPAAQPTKKLTLHVTRPVHESLNDSADAMGGVPVAETLRRYIQLGNFFVEFYGNNPDAPDPIIEIGDGRSLILPLKAILGSIESPDSTS